MDENRNIRNGRIDEHQGYFRGSKNHPNHLPLPHPYQYYSGNDSSYTPSHRSLSPSYLPPRSQNVNYIPIDGRFPSNLQYQDPRYRQRSLSDIHEMGRTAPNSALLRSISYEDFNGQRSHGMNSRRSRRLLIDTRNNDYYYPGNGSYRTGYSSGSISPYASSLISDSGYNPSIYSERPKRVVKLVPFQRSSGSNDGTTMDINHNQRSIMTTLAENSHDNSLTEIAVSDEPRIVKTGASGKKFVLLKPESAVVGSRRAAAAERQQIQVDYSQTSYRNSRETSSAISKPSTNSAVAKLNLKLPLWKTKQKENNNDMQR